MGILKRLLTEAPIGDYSLIGNWGDKEKSNSFHDPKDRKLVQNPKAIEKVRKKFGQTEYVLNFYFVNLPGMRKHSETGLVDRNWLTKNMPKAWEMIQQREQQEGTDPSEAINVIWVTNSGTNKVPLTSWIMAHRLGHAINGFSTRQNKTLWDDAETEFRDFFTRAIEDIYSWKVKRNFSGFYGMERENREFPFWDNPDVAKLFEAVGTMRSARQGNLGGRPYEFLYEIFAQYTTTGSINFREFPKTFGRRRTTRYARDEDMREMYSRDLNDWFADTMGSRFDIVLGATVGKYLVM